MKRALNYNLFRILHRTITWCHLYMINRKCLSVSQKKDKQLHGISIIDKQGCDWLTNDTLSSYSPLSLLYLYPVYVSYEYFSVIRVIDVSVRTGAWLRGKNSVTQSSSKSNTFLFVGSFCKFGHYRTSEIIIPWNTELEMDLETEHLN